MTQDKVIVFTLPPRWADGNMGTDGLENVWYLFYYTSEGSLLQYLEIISRGLTSSLLQLLLFFALIPPPLPTPLSPCLPAMCFDCISHCAGPHSFHLSTQPTSHGRYWSLPPSAAPGLNSGAWLDINMHVRASQLVHINVCKTGGAVTFILDVLFLEQKSAVMMQHAHLHKSGVLIGTLMCVNRNMSEVVSGGCSLLFLWGLQPCPPGAALKHRRLALICIVIRAFSFESTAHWNMMTDCCGRLTVHIQLLLLLLAPTHQTTLQKVSHSC